LSITGVPAFLQPADSKQMTTVYLDNGVTGFGWAIVSGGAIGFGATFANNSAGFTAAGNKGVPPQWSLSYPL
jgi:hypothetical protein